MKWLLFVMVFGIAPFDTGLKFDSLDQCIEAEASIRRQILVAFDKGYAASPANDATKGVPRTESTSLRLYGLANETTCVPSN